MITEAEKSANGSCGLRAIRVRSGALGRLVDSNEKFKTHQDEVYAWADEGKWSVMAYVPSVQQVWFDRADVLEIEPAT